jgi:hypothetical protein
MKHIITSVQLGAKVNKNFWNNIKKFKEKHGVDTIYVFLMNGKTKDDILHPSVMELIRSGEIELIDKNFSLNAKVRVYNTKVLAQNINPMAGQSSKLPPEYSYVMPGTKSRFFTVASIGTNARFFTSTGSLTEPNYKVEAVSSGMVVKRGLQALAQHQYGFIYFQNNGRGKFDIYPLSSDRTGNFHYLNEKYHSGKLSKSVVESLILGDIHHGQTNKYARETYLKRIETLKPKVVILHDLFDGQSINHHTRDRWLERVRNATRNQASLENELKSLLKEINYLANRFPDVKFVVAESNHDIFLRTYVDSRKHHYEEYNYLMGIRIFPQILDLRKIVLEEALKLVGKLPRNFKFLRENDSFKVRGVELGQHGHKGANGSRGSDIQFKRLNLKTITAHKHSPLMEGNVMVVGTNTNLEQGYTIGGASSWMHADGILYPNGTYSLLTAVHKQPIVR